VDPKDNFPNVWLLVIITLQKAASIYRILQTFMCSRWPEQYVPDASTYLVRLMPPPDIHEHLVKLYP